MSFVMTRQLSFAVRQVGGDERWPVMAPARYICSGWPSGSMTDGIDQLRHGSASMMT